MQHNNKNILIADELDAISNKITQLDKNEVTTSISEIHNLHKEIEEVAREHDLTTLLAIVDWVDLSTELDDDNKKKIEALLNNDAYSNWLDVVVSLLREYNDNLRPVIHQSLTAPEWVIKPSTILLKDIASWIAAIKVEHLSNTDIYTTSYTSNEDIVDADLENTLDDDDKEEQSTDDVNLNDADVVIDNNSNNLESDSRSELNSTENIIEDQLKKVDLASEESLLHQNVFEEIDQDILEKDYTTEDVSDDILNQEVNSEDAIIPLMETEKSSIDDEDFEITNLNPSEVSAMDADIESNYLNETNKFNDEDLLKEISDVHQALASVNLNSTDIFSSKDIFTKHLDKLALITEDTNLKSIVPVVDWTQRNLILFEDNTTQNIEQFITSTTSWSWIENIVNCLKDSDNKKCLDHLTNSLTAKEWLEPIEKHHLEELLIGINNSFTTENSDVIENIESDFNSETSSSEDIDSLDKADESLEQGLPELLDNPISIDSSIAEDEISNDSLDVKETSGLKMTWDDDTHPELLMVYLEETPSQFEELLPLLDKISSQQASTEDKTTAARLAHTIKGGSAVVGITALADISSHLEELLEHSITSQLNDNMLQNLPEIGRCIEDTFKAIQVQGDEPETFLANFNLLESYPYDLDSVISEADELDKTADIDADLIEEAQTVDSNDIEVNDNDIIDLIDTEITDNTIETFEVQDEEVEVDTIDSNETITEATNTDDIEETAETILETNDSDEEVAEETSDIDNADTESSGIAAMAGMVASAVIAKEVVDKVSTDSVEEDNAEVEEVKAEEVKVEEVKVEEVAAEVKAEVEEVKAEAEEVKAETDEIKAEAEADEILEDTVEVAEEEKEEEILASEKSGFKMTWHDDTHPELLMVYLEETPTQINELVPLLQKISENKADAEEKHTASRMAHTIKGGSAIVGLTTLSEISYRLETLLDHSVKHQLPEDILETLPKAGACIEELFDEIQMLGEEPEAYFGIFKKLDNYVENIDENDDEVLELSSVALPDFILNQNKVSDSDADEAIEVEANVDENIDVEEVNEVDNAEETVESEEVIAANEDLESDVEAIVSETDTTEEAQETEEITEDIKTETLEVESEADSNETVAVTEEDSDDSEVEDEIEAEEINEVKESVAVEAVKLDKLKTKEDVNNILLEIDDIVMNLIGHSEASDQPKDYLEKCSVELDRFELMTDLSGYPELSLLSKWCQSNLETHVKQENKEFTAFIQSNEIWSWVEHVGECLRESDDMSHMSSLSVELMREDWLNAIKMEDLQTVLLALRHLEDTGVAEPAEVEATVENEDEVISWDKDVHPELLAVYFQETPDQIDHVAGLLHKISRGESTPEENKEAARIAHTIKGSSGVVGLNQLLELTHHLEDILDYSVNNDITPETADLLSEASDCMESLFETIQNKQAPPDELPSVLKSLSTFSGNLSPEDKASTMHSFDDADVEDSIAKTSIIETSKEVTKTIEAATNDDVKAFTEKSVTSKVDTNEAFIRVPIKVIDKLLNLAGELVTTSNQVSDNLAKTQETNKTIRAQDERVIAMLEDLNKTIEQQEKDQQNLFSSMENSDFDSLEMDTYNELNSVASLLSEGILDSQEIDNTLSRQLDELSERLHSLDKLNKTFSDVILSSRMVTIDTIVPRLERIVRQTCRKTNKKAQLIVKGNNLNVDTDILNNLVDPLLHMLRNSIDHGIETPEVRLKQNKDETGLIELEFSRDGNNILMTLSDDGAGIDPEKIFKKAIEKEIISPDHEFSDADAIKLILQAGFSTQENVTDISGRGVGMDVVNTSIQDLNGTMGIDSNLGEGTSFNLTIPLTLITNTTLLVKVEDNLIAIPTDTIEQIMYQQASTMVQRGDDFFVTHNDVEIQTKSLGELLNWPHQLIDIDKSYNVLIIKTDNETHAIHVDGIESSREVVVKRLSPWISPAKGVIGACHLNDGGVAPVINLVTVAKEAAASDLLGVNKVAPKQIIKPSIKKNILVVDDSLSNRKALSLIIEKTEYEVLTAVDGLDALRVMNENEIDLVFSDLEMPRMNGLELTQSIRAWNDKKETPIVMITSRTTNKHRELANKAGVDDYLTKPVETEILLNSIDTWLEAKEPLEV